jgi:hypothetical protein
MDAGLTHGRFGGAVATAARRHADALAAVLFFGFVAFIHGIPATVMNNDVIVADAWLHHRAWVIPLGPWVEAPIYHGLHYVIEAPFPALLMVPLVALQGVAANETLVCLIVAALGIAGVYRLGEHVTGSTRAAIALTAFAATGTSFLSCAADGSVWCFAHIAAFTFSIFAINEMLGRQRGWLVGLFACAAGLSRYSLLPAILVYLVWLLLDRRIRSAAVAFVVGVLCAIPWAFYNEARWGSLYDRGFTIVYHQDPRATANGYTFSTFFVRPPHFIGAFPWMTPPMFGFALTWMSLALIGVLLTLPMLRRRPIAMLWIAMLLSAVPSFLYYDTGGVELGMRHALDFEPFAIALLAFALRTRWDGWLRFLLYASAAVGLYESLIFIIAPQLITL